MHAFISNMTPEERLAWYKTICDPADEELQRQLRTSGKVTMTLEESRDWYKANWARADEELQKQFTYTANAQHRALHDKQDLEILQERHDILLRELHELTSTSFVVPGSVPPHYLDAKTIEKLVVEIIERAEA